MASEVGFYTKSLHPSRFRGQWWLSVGHYMPLGTGDNINISDAPYSTSARVGGGGRSTIIYSMDLNPAFMSYPMEKTLK